MNHQEPYISLTTLVETSPLTGFSFGHNDTIRNNQDIEFILNLQKKTSIELQENESKSFYFGTLDFLPYKNNGKTLFKFLEYSGTGSGGISNISFFAFNAVLEEFKNVYKCINSSQPVILLAYSDSQSLSNSIPRKFVFERFFFANAMKEGLKEKYGTATILTLPEIIKKNSFQPAQPTIVIGFLKDFMKYIRSENSQVLFFEQPVNCLLNDTLCNSVVNLFPEVFQKLPVYTMNAIFQISANKHLAYALHNEVLKTHKFENFIEPVNYELAMTKEELIEKVYTKVQNAEKVVIKPCGGAVGMGVEFFLEPASREAILCQVEASVQQIERFQGNNFACYPYTISELIDYLAVNNPDHPLDKHKIELRMIVYREKNTLKAFPSVVRASAMPYNPEKFDKLMLLSYASLGDSKITLPKAKFLLPLSNKNTLKLLNIKEDELESLCLFSTSYIKEAIHKAYCASDDSIIEKCYD